MCRKKLWRIFSINWGFYLVNKYGLKANLGAIQLQLDPTLHAVLRLVTAPSFMSFIILIYALGMHFFINHGQINCIGFLLYAFPESIKVNSKFFRFLLNFSMGCLIGITVSVVDIPGINPILVFIMLASCYRCFSIILSQSLAIKFSISLIDL